jgi:hypothetical protein
VDILKEPFALDPLRHVVLGALELKDGQKFNGNLGLFVKWAGSDPRTKTLDLKSPPHPDSSRVQTPPEATSATAGGG